MNEYFSEFTFTGLKDNSRLSDSMQTHLKNVYFALCLASFSAVLGCYLNLSYSLMQGGLLTALMGMACLWMMKGYAPTKENELIRLGFLAGFGFLEGLSVTQLVAIAGPELVLQAIGSTLAVFVSFTIVAGTAKERSFLYLGGMLATGISMLLWMSFFNMFFRSSTIFTAELYLGAFVFAGYIIFDTQMILEKARMGDLDYIDHALKLFIDLVGLFVRILVILLKNQSEEQERKKRRRQ